MPVVLSLKFHYLACLLKHVAAELEKNNSDGHKEEKTSTDEKGCTPAVEPCIKQLLRCRASDCGEVIMELWIRDAIKSFHCLEMPLFLQVVDDFLMRKAFFQQIVKAEGQAKLLTLPGKKYSK
ncbi:hypothetical protein FHG87_023806 [Trinorchestia longiramus]|nr:hypothetical protein FHG87_023806 [Trinorchestia longiramus]